MSQDSGILPKVACPDIIPGVVVVCTGGGAGCRFEIGPVCWSLLNRAVPAAPRDQGFGIGDQRLGMGNLRARRAAVAL